MSNTITVCLAVNVCVTKALQIESMIFTHVNIVQWWIQKLGMEGQETLNPFTCLWWVYFYYSVGLGGIISLLPISKNLTYG